LQLSFHFSITFFPLISTSFILRAAPPGGCSISTAAGQVSVSAFADSPAATFYSPWGVAAPAVGPAAGTVFVADGSNRVRALYEAHPYPHYPLPARAHANPAKILSTTVTSIGISR
jgi:hypothetical protein